MRDGFDAVKYKFHFSSHRNVHFRCRRESHKPHSPRRPESSDGGSCDPQVLGLCSQVHVGALASPAREGCAVKTELWGNLGLCFKVRFVVKNGHSYLEFLRNGWNLEESRASVDAQ